MTNTISVVDPQDKHLIEVLIQQIKKCDGETIGYILEESSQREQVTNQWDRL